MWKSSVLLCSLFLTITELLGSQVPATGSDMRYEVNLGEGVPLTWKFLYGLGKMTVLRDWREIRLVHAFATGEHVISLQNLREEFGYLDRAHSERWKIVPPREKQPFPLSQDAYAKIYSILEFFGRSDIKPGDELLISFQYPKDKVRPYRSILLQIQAKTLFKFGASNVPAWKFHGWYFESEKELRRADMAGKPYDLYFEGYDGAEGEYWQAILLLELYFKQGERYGKIEVTSLAPNAHK